MDSSMAIHWGKIFNKAPDLDGILDTLQCKFKTEDVAKKLFLEGQVQVITLERK